MAPDPNGFIPKLNLVFKNKNRSTLWLSNNSKLYWEIKERNLE